MSFGNIDGSADLKASGDYFIKGGALPNATTSYSDERKVNDGEAGVEIVAYAKTDIASAALSFDLLSDDSPDVDTSGSVDLELFSQTAGSFSAGDEIFRVIPTQDIGLFGKIKTTTATDKQLETVDVYVTPIANR